MIEERDCEVMKCHFLRTERTGHHKVGVLSTHEMIIVIISIGDMGRRWFCSRRPVGRGFSNRAAQTSCIFIMMSSETEGRAGFNVLRSRALNLTPIVSVGYQP